MSHSHTCKLYMYIHVMYKIFLFLFGESLASRNGFDLIDVTTRRPTIANPTVVERDLFFHQGGDQLNSEHKGTEDIQPETTMSACTIVAPGVWHLWVETII